MLVPLASENVNPQPKLGKEVLVDPEDYFSLPANLAAHFRQVNHVSELMPWQKDCIHTLSPIIRTSWENVVIRAPTGAGKSLVSDLLVLYHLTARKPRSKALYVVPYVSLLSEKYTKLTELFEPLGLAVVSLSGNKSYRLQDRADVLVCTIEKANQLVYLMLEERKMDMISVVVVDEVQFVGDEQRGALLEILLAKLLFRQSCCSGVADVPVPEEFRIIAISATIDNFADFAAWMRAKAFVCEQASLRIDEYIKAGSRVYDGEGKLREIVKEAARDKRKVVALLERELVKGPVLLFASSKALCEELAAHLTAFLRVENHKKSEVRKIVDETPMEERKHYTNRLDWLLKGVACHHAGMVAEERLLIERLYREGNVTVLVCTSTLAAGVNLPATTVMILGLTQGLAHISSSTYKQMRGRAGRMTKALHGQCFLLCREAELQSALKLIQSTCHAQNPIMSTLGRSGCGLRRLALEAAALGFAHNESELGRYIDNTLFKTQKETSIRIADMIAEATNFLISADLLESGKDQTYKCTQLGTAVSRSGLQVEEMMVAYWDLAAAAERFLPCNPVFAVYLLTPVFLGVRVCWDTFRSYYNRTVMKEEDMSAVAQYLGIDEEYIVAWTQSEQFPTVPLPDKRQRRTHC